MAHELDIHLNPLIELLREHNIQCLVQVGANDGYESHRIKEALGCRVVCIEADTRCAPYSENIEFQHAMIGSSDCIMPFYQMGDSALSSGLVREDGPGERVELQQFRLDTFCKERGIVPDALIVDTEGTTMDVFNGIGHLIDNIKVVYAEIQTANIRPGCTLLPEADKFMTEHGLTIRDGLPSYVAHMQNNYTWVRTSGNNTIPEAHGSTHDA